MAGSVSSFSETLNELTGRIGSLENSASSGGVDPEDLDDELTEVCNAVVEAAGVESVVVDAEDDEDAGVLAAKLNELIEALDVPSGCRTTLK